ncbi:hypothetical protein B0H15DRAFT_952712 [Mycena belliarum]|uniref:Uncharacterized protein n=1 Tax=Mycena belliarum TaxID=1033014 RepID=A0AAD6U1X0_9AGAR|nr:hypothetical protein B0H15DRAFT_952712 [Mycena belliae]
MLGMQPLLKAGKSDVQSASKTANSDGDAASLAPQLLHMKICADLNRANTVGGRHSLQRHVTAASPPACTSHRRQHVSAIRCPRSTRSSAAAVEPRALEMHPLRVRCSLQDTHARPTPCAPVCLVWLARRRRPRPFDHARTPNLPPFSNPACTPPSPWYCPPALPLALGPATHDFEDRAPRPRLARLVVQPSGAAMYKVSETWRQATFRGVAIFSTRAGRGCPPPRG